MWHEDRLVGGVPARTGPRRETEFDAAGKPVAVTEFADGLEPYRTKMGDVLTPNEEGLRGPWRR